MTGRCSRALRRPERCRQRRQRLHRAGARRPVRRGRARRWRAAVAAGPGWPAGGRRRSLHQASRGGDDSARGVTELFVPAPRRASALTTTLPGPLGHSGVLPPWRLRSRRGPGIVAAHEVPGRTSRAASGGNRETSRLAYNNWLQKTPNGVWPSRRPVLYAATKPTCRAQPHADRRRAHRRRPWCRRQATGAPRRNR